MGIGAMEKTETATPKLLGGCRGLDPQLDPSWTMSPEPYSMVSLASVQDEYKSARGLQTLQFRVRKICGVTSCFELRVFAVGVYISVGVRATQ